MDPKAVVLDISSDEEVGWGQTRGNGNGRDEFGWISEMLDEVVDRESDDDVVVVGELILNPKQKFKSSVAVAKSSAKDIDDDDCLVLDGDPDRPVAIENDSAADSDDLLVVGEKGQVACRDYPHPRHLCAKFPFTSSSHESHCDQCHCYVCDSIAPCVHWGTGISSIDHCHATDKAEFWKVQRKSSKKCDTTAPQARNFAGTSLSMGLPQVNQVPPMIPLELNPMPQNEISRPTSIRACSMSTNFGITNTINQGRNQQSGYVVTRNKFGRYLVPKQLIRSCNNVNPRQNRHNVGNFGPRVTSPRAVFKRTRPAGVDLTTNRCVYSSPNNNYGSEYSINPPIVARSSDDNQIKCQDFRSLMPPVSSTYWRSSQPNVGSIPADSLPSQPGSSSQPNTGNISAYAVPSQPLAPSQSYMGGDLPNSVSSQTHVSCQQNVGSISPNAVPSQPQVYSQQPVPIPNGWNQSESSLDTLFTDFDLTWDTPTSQINQQPPVDDSQVLSVEPTYEPSLVTDFDSHLSGNTNLESLDFPYDSWIMDNQPVSEALEVSLPPGLNILSPDPTSIDADFFF